MAQPSLSADEALKAHRRFLQEVLTEVMHVLSVGDASTERLVASMQIYWAACFQRREIRRAVLEATKGGSFEQAVEPMGKPFLLMVRAELMPQYGKQADDIALAVYDEARAIAVDEALSGQIALERRNAVIALIRGEPAKRGGATVTSRVQPSAAL